MTTLWDTTGTAVVRELASARRTGGAVTSGNALTLVVVVDEAHVEEAESAATVAASMNPCRLLIVTRLEIESPKPRLDAEVLVGGRLGPGEAVVMRMFGRLALHAESVTLPLLAPDAPIVTWWHGTPPERIANDPLGVFSDRRVTDLAWLENGLGGLFQRAVDYAPGDTDLSWTRTTPWRSAMVSAFDMTVATPTSARVAGDKNSPSAHLLAGWLKARLGLDTPVDSSRRKTGQAGVSSVALAFDDDSELKLSREDGSVVISLTGQQDQRVSVPDRELGELMAEELRRLDADEPYADALGAVTGLVDLSDRPAARTHVWVDPALAGTL